MSNDHTILGGVEQDAAEELLSRRDALVKSGKMSATTIAALSIGSVPVALAALSRDAWGQSTPSTVQATIDFALALEIFENEFYKAVLGTSSSAAQNAAFATVRAQVPASALPALQQIQKHEASHVSFLMANGAVNVFNLSATSFDFTGSRGSSAPGPFARATSELAFLLAVAQAAEDTGVRAYKGQAGNLMSNTVVLEAALRIHSVEARHASKIRRLRRATGAPSVVRYSGTVSGTAAAAAGVSNISNPPAAVVAAFDAIYAGENTTMQGTVDVSTNTGLGLDSAGLTAAATESFDEPLTRAQVVAIVQPFFIPTIA